MSSDPHFPEPHLADPYSQIGPSPGRFAGGTLRECLASSFGFADFRANQEAVCQAALDGRDVLLVMPTGAGKSLCYQLPGIVRGGTTLVISPLIALMEDQSSKLSQLGFNAARIHSGMDRGASRAVCVAYLRGELDFLFIAPERMKVPGFPEMLAKRKPSLIAVDEAHCISQWGHDFRPDYRVLGHHLQALRPAPIIALTATATPIVQDDVVRQLRLQGATRFIHGFRRHNLAIESVETPVPERTAKIVKLLTEAGRRPAIVYAPTRKKSEELAAVLNEHFQAAAYHAGMDAQDRERVQHDFLESRLEVVVATTAFGMGIDKADVRTVVHAAMPGTVEGYYQEIGRAGRDGQPSRAVLLYSFADRRTHDFFFERDYPATELLTKVYGVCTAEPRSRDSLRKKLRMDAEEFDHALERLELLGACTIEPDGAVSLGEDARTDFSWRSPYQAQVAQRKAQIEAMQRFAESHQCRMAALVRHFGDTEDRSAFCGLCDVCSPERAVAQQFRELTTLEERGVAAVLRDLKSGMAKATGKLHRDVFPREELKRDDFESLLGAMLAAGWITIEDASFEKEGRTLAYRRASLTRDGELAEADEVNMLRIRDSASEKTSMRKSKGPGGTAKAPAKFVQPDVPLSAEDERLEQKLRVWRSGEAKKQGFAAFCVFSDRTMRAIAVERPVNIEDLQSVDGIGPAKVARYGAEICRLCAEADG
jgi:RecQ family ATP-dependent DNA helicase